MAPSNQPLRAEAGVVIGGYELVRRLGRGGMAEVWVARKALGNKGTKFVAIKLIADHYVGDERYTRMFRSEAELASILSHANIVQVFDEGEDEGRSYLVMEWVDGLNLLKLGAVLALIDDEERRCRVISYIIGQVLYALGYAHSITSHDGSALGIVHRDVSPQNVLVSNHGEVKLTDFGVAYYNVQESSGIHVKGKVRYMSPEQIAGKTRSPTVDLYAVGALLHELLDGRKFRGDYDDGQDLFAAVISGEVPALSRTAPRELDDLRLGLLAPDPTDRIQTAEDAIGWLQRYPGYGDARPELTKLCSSLTGVVKPRAGPGQSSKVPMADQRTAQFNGPKGLARPRVNPEPAQLAARPAGPAHGMAAQSNVITATALQGPRHAATPPVITGETEFISPQQPVGLGKKQVIGGSSTPPRVMSSAAARASAPAADVGPVMLHAAAPVRSPDAYAGGSPVPHAVVDQRSHPIAIAVPEHDRSVPKVPPTERLGLSETSGPQSNATETIDASMLVEVTSNSRTDGELYPVRAPHEGTDPSREIHPQGVPPSHSMSIPVAHPGRGSAIALLVVGLLLVALTSVSVTWWLFTRNKDEGRVAAGGGQAAAPKDAPSEVPKPPAKAPSEQPPGPKTKAAPPPPVEPPEPAEPPPDGVQAEIAAADGAAEDDDAGATTGGEQDAAAEAAAKGDEGAQEEATKAETPTSAPPTKDSDKPKPATVIASGLPGIANGEIVIGGVKLTISRGQTVKKKLTAGKKKVEWRTDPKAALEPAKALVLEPGKTIKLQLTFTGPRVLL